MMVLRCLAKTVATSLAVAILVMLPVPSASASVLQIIAPVPNLSPGDSETISVMFTADHAFTLYAADIEIAYDTTRFSVSNVSLGTLDNSAGFSIFAGTPPYTSPLQASISTSSAGAQIAMGQTGTLETFTLTALGNAPVGGNPGDINLLANAGRTNTAVYDNTFAAVVLTPAPSNGLDANDATVTVGVTVPEPSSFLMMGLAGGLIAVTSRFRKKNKARRLPAAA